MYGRKCSARNCLDRKKLSGFQIKQPYGSIAGMPCQKGYGFFTILFIRTAALFVFSLCLSVLLLLILFSTSFCLSIWEYLFPDRNWQPCVAIKSVRKSFLKACQPAVASVLVDNSVLQLIMLFFWFL